MTQLSDIGYIPYDVSCIIHSYYNDYVYKEFDIIQRFVDLFAYHITDHTADSALAGSIGIAEIMQYSDGVFALNNLKKVLNYMQNANYNQHTQHMIDNVYFIISKVAFHSFEAVWKADVLRTMIDMIIWNAYGTRISSAKMFPPLNEIISMTNDTEILRTIIVEYDILYAVCSFIKTVLAQYKADKSDNDVINALKALLNMMRGFLNGNDEIKNITINKIKKYHGIEVLVQIRDDTIQLQGYQAREPKRLANVILDQFV